MKPFVLVAAVMALIPVASLADQPALPEMDAATISGQRNQALDDFARLVTMLKTEQAKAAQREKDWAEYSAPLWQQRNP